MPATFARMSTPPASNASSAARRIDAESSDHVELDGSNPFISRASSSSLYLRAGRQNHFGPRLMHAAGDSQTDAAAGARHQRGLTFERKGIQNAILSPQLATVKSSYEFSDSFFAAKFGIARRDLENYLSEALVAGRAITPTCISNTWPPVPSASTNPSSRAPRRAFRWASACA